MKKNEVKATEAAEEKAVSTISSLSLGDFSDFATEGGATGLESLDSTDLKLPKYKIVQMTSQEFTQDGIPHGHFYNTVTKEHTEFLDCVLLAMGKSRVMWPDAFKRGDKPLCRSFDGKTKVANGSGEGNCATCKFSQWGTDNEKPPCTQGYVWLATDANAQPFRISANGSSVSPTKDFLNSVAPKLSLPGGKHLGIFVFKVRLSTVKTTNESGTFYILQYDIVGTINKDSYATLESMSQSLRELFLTAIDKDTQSVDDASESGEEVVVESTATEAPKAEKKAGALF